MPYDDQNVFDDPSLMAGSTGGLGGLGGYFNNLNTKGLSQAQALITAGAPTTKPQNMMQTLAPLMQGDKSAQQAQLKARLKAMGMTDDQITLALANGQGGSSGGLLTGLFNKPSA